MIEKLPLLMKIPLVKSVIVLATGTAAAQVISFISSPIITRLYGPEAFGLMGVFMAIVGMIVPISALTFPIAIVLPRSNKEAWRLAKLSILITLGITVVVSLSIFLFHHQITSLFHLTDISKYLFLIPLVIIGAGFLQVKEQWLIRTKQFGITAKVNVFHAFLTQGSKVTFGFFYPFASVLIIISAFSQLIKALMLFVVDKRSIPIKFHNNHTRNITFKQLLRKYKDFPVYRAPEVFVNANSQSIPILMLTSFFGPVSAGFYTLVRNVMSIPSQLIGKSIGDVFYPRIAEAKNNDENLTSLIQKATLILAAIGVVPYGIIILFGPWIFGFVFGDEWIRAGEYARWITLWSFFALLNRPSVTALPVLSLQAFHLKFSILMLITRIVVLGGAYYFSSSDIVSVALFSISGAILNIFLIYITIQKCSQFEKGLYVS